MTVAVIPGLLEELEEAVESILSLDHLNLVDESSGDAAELNEDGPYPPVLT